MSAQARGPAELDKTFGRHRPMMHMTGTIDDSPMGDSKANDRRVPFDHIRRGRPIPGHLPRRRPHGLLRPGPAFPAAATTPLSKSLIRTATTAFWDAYLKSDRRAKAFLVGEGLAKTLADKATLERKRLNSTQPPNRQPSD